MDFHKINQALGLRTEEDGVTRKGSACLSPGLGRVGILSFRPHVPTKVFVRAFGVLYVSTSGCLFLVSSLANETGAGRTVMEVDP